MATDNPTVTHNGDFTVTTYKYSGLDNGDDGYPIKTAQADRINIQISGTFGTGGTLVIEGSNSSQHDSVPTTDASFKTLQFVNTSSGDPIDISCTAAGTNDIGDVLQKPVWLRPHVTAGDGSTDLTAVITVYRQNDKRQ